MRVTNPYLVAARNHFADKRLEPLEPQLPPTLRGSQLTENGFLAVERFALNETADRLARFARRAHHSHVRHQPGLIAQIVPKQVAAEIVENIISDYHAVT